jgi:hypothetical protein
MNPRHPLLAGMLALLGASAAVAQDAGSAPAVPAAPAPSAAPASAPATVTPAATGKKSSGTKPAANAAARPAAATATRPKGSGASDRIDLDAAQITGNRELPKVLYIVPWKRPDLGDLLGKPVNSLLDEVLAPVDRDVFKRENRYFEALQPAGRPAAEPTATPEGGANPPPVAKPEP